ncbi:integrase family protein [Methanosalsum zhilinae DSM 4017]|uniref:Integrase family protein n=1 Tax=Methanosalsum zhilinae (strain DSM 4017 / NBRC 107636 / OCM 62 / WeN5) TaxID=679901 RepID=F7XNT3_METZD|nr:site-specific integrase [Methanosalsum zhilinae]AEH61284.1 integrase family protein [Methanosalsum zhilinae DSM 4017]
MAKPAMKNLSTYVTYEDFLAFEKAAKEFEERAPLKRSRKGNYPLLIRLLFFTGARIAEIVGTPRRILTQCLSPGNNKRKGRCQKWCIERSDRVCIDSNCEHFRIYIQKYHHGIRVKDISFRDRLIAVYGKSVKSDELKARTVIIDQTTLDLIKEHIEKYSLKPDDKILNINENGAKTFLPKIRDKLNLPWVSAHKFRHGHAIYCIQKGMDIRTLQLQLGHEDLATTAIYLQFAVDDRIKVYDKVFNAKPTDAKIQCPGCGFSFKVKKNKEIDFEDRMNGIFKY